MHLSVRNLTKRFGSVVALDHVELDVQGAELVCLLGPSGCGKTTLLRIVAGLEQASEGEIRLDGENLTDTPARHRQFGIVFQSYSLFPNLTAGENIGYGLKLRRAQAPAIAARVKELLALVDLPGLEDRLPHQLSGGQQQRVALARALAVEPRLLLLDEPLSALDAKVRVSLRDEIRMLQQRLGVPTLMVTHDQEEALAISDRVVCMNAGRIEQADAPERLYSAPKTRFVAEFVGQMNFLTPQQRAGLPGPLVLGAAGTPPADRIVGIRPEHILLTPEGTGGPNAFPARIVSRSFLGATTRVRARAGSVELDIDVAGAAAPLAGEAVTVVLPAERLNEFTA